jgi:prepilin-type N-terminal cleavage/methylation domain-containing protein
MPYPSTRGFTLIEMLTVVAIIAIMAALSVGGIEYMNKRAQFSSASAQLFGSLRRTQAEAAGRGDYTAFVIDTAGGRYWGIETAPFDVSTFNPASPPGTLIVADTLPSGSGFGPDGGFSGTVPWPFSGVPISSGASPFCSFCISNGYGAIFFEPGGPIAFSPGGPDGGLQQFTMTGQYGTATRTILVGIVAKTGAIERFEQ